MTFAILHVRDWWVGAKPNILYVFVWVQVDERKSLLEPSGNVLEVRGPYKAQVIYYKLIIND